MQTEPITLPDLDPEPDSIAPPLLQAARDWIADREWRDLADINGLSARAVIRGVREHYAGGWPQFDADGGLA